MTEEKEWILGGVELKRIHSHSSILGGEICHFPTQLSKLKFPPRGNFVRKQTYLQERRGSSDHLPNVFKYEQTTKEHKAEEVSQDHDKERAREKEGKLIPEETGKFKELREKQQNRL